MTSVAIPRTTEFIFSSDPNQGAINVQQNGGYFEVAFNEPIELPPDASNVEVKVANATIWWTVPNIITGVNDIFSGVVNAIAIPPSAIPEGLYDLNGLQSAIRTIMINHGVTQAYATTNFQLIADNATQKVQIFLANADTIHVGVANSVFQLAGWPVGSLDVVGPGIFTAPNIANFNTINYFLIHTDLVQRGIRFNNNWNQTVAQVQIDVPPGSQINYAPYNPPSSGGQELAGQQKWRAKFWLTDQNNNIVNTFGEFWSVRIVVTFIQPRLIR